MKRPQHMTMRELLGLPILCDVGALGLLIENGDPRASGGAFQDDEGRLWRTQAAPSGWIRYPAHLSLLAEARCRPLTDESTRTPSRLTVAIDADGFRKAARVPHATHAAVGAILRCFAQLRHARRDIAA